MRTHILKQVLLILILIISTKMIAQTPQKMSFQAIGRDINNNLLINQNIGIRVAILKSQANGPEVYSEEHNTTTNDNGLFTIEIGTGNNNSAHFADIEWGENEYFILTEIDPNGGNTYTISATSPINSVPYALHAANGYWKKDAYGIMFEKRIRIADTNSKALSIGGNGDVEVDAPGIQAGRFVIKPNGNIGINNAYPSQKLDINGKIKITDGTQGFGKILTSDANGVARWENAPISPSTPSYWALNSNGSITNSNNSGKVGIGTNNPNAPLSFPPTLEKKITLYPGATGDVGFAVTGNRLQIYSDHPYTDVAIGYDDRTIGFQEKFAVKANGNIGVNRSVGISGDVLTSGGEYSPARWESNYKFAIGPTDNRAMVNSVTPNFSNPQKSFQNINITTPSTLLLSVNYDYTLVGCGIGSINCTTAGIITITLFKTGGPSIIVKSIPFFEVKNGLRMFNSLSNIPININESGNFTVHIEITRGNAETNSFSAAISECSLLLLPNSRRL